MLQEIIDDIFQDKKLKGRSIRWANWQSMFTPTTCRGCVVNHGKIVPIEMLTHGYNVNAHDRCLCIYVPMRTKKIGTATTMGQNGPEVQLKYFNSLPDYYVTKEDAELLGWKKYLGNLHDVLPGKTIGGDVYKNSSQKLPESPGRIWYEADINYDGGYRNRDRILYSNDGLIFVSYDHYQTFYEITN